MLNCVKFGDLKKGFLFLFIFTIITFLRERNRVAIIKYLLNIVLYIIYYPYYFLMQALFGMLLIFKKIKEKQRL